MRILYLADIRFPLERANGIQSMETCHALASRGHRVTMVVRPDTQRPPRDPLVFYGLPPIDGLRIEYARAGGSPAVRRAAYVAAALSRSLGRVRHDAIVTRDLGVASALLRIPRLLRAPVVYEAHGLASETAAALPDLLSTAPPAGETKRRRLAPRDARVWRKADGYVTITNGLAAELTRRFGPRPRLAVVPDGVRLARDRAMPPPAAGPFTAAYAGHLYPWKGVDLLIDALARLPEARAIVIGGHEAEPDIHRVRARAAEAGVAARVTFTGFVSPGDVAGHLRGVHAFVLPNPASALSTGFTSPLKLFEYMAAGRPIVASALPSIREVLRDGENAILVEPGNGAAIADGLRRLMNDRALGDRLACRAFADVAAFGWDQRAARLESALDEVVRAS